MNSVRSRSFRTEVEAVQWGLHCESAAEKPRWWYDQITKHLPFLSMSTGYCCFAEYTFLFLKVWYFCVYIIIYVSCANCLFRLTKFDAAAFRNQRPCWSRKNVAGVGFPSFPSDFFLVFILPLNCGWKIMWRQQKFRPNLKIFEELNRNPPVLAPIRQALKRWECWSFSWSFNCVFVIFLQPQLPELSFSVCAHSQAFTLFCGWWTVRKHHSCNMPFPFCDETVCLILIDRRHVLNFYVLDDVVTVVLLFACCHSYQSVLGFLMAG